MVYQKENNIICLGNLKQAAIYFDNIIPISMEFVGGEPDEANLILQNLFGQFANDKSISTQYNKILEEILYEINEIARFHLGIDKHFAFNEEQKKALKFQDSIAKEKLNNNIYSLFKSDELMGDYYALCHRYNLPMVTNKLKWQDFFLKVKNIFIREKCDLFFSKDLLSDSATSENNITFSIANMPIVETTNVDWLQIVEFRKDENARKKLRNLRLFLYENYADKEKAYIEDDLLKRLDNYYSSCEDWGFETKTSILSVVLDSKNLQTTFAATAGAALFGAPIVMGASLLIGASIEIGKIALTIAKQKHALQNLRRDHELAYIIEAKEKFEE